MNRQTKNQKGNIFDMEKLDFSKYAGTYSLSEARQLLTTIAEDILEAHKKEAIARAKKIHGNKFNYEVRKGSVVNLTKLKAGKRVCACSLKGYHILLTEKKK